MNSIDYKNAWQNIANEDTIELAGINIENLINGQRMESNQAVRKYLKFDLALKLLAIIALLVTTALFISTNFAFALGGTLVLGIVVAFFQFRQIENSQVDDYGQPTQLLISTLLIKLRALVPKYAFLTSMTNPLLILAGSYLYLYSKYGLTLEQSSEDIAVTAVLMFIGFLINFIAISIQQHSHLNDLEISNHVLISEEDSGLISIAQRRKRRLVISVVLICLGFILFLILLGIYFYSI